MGSLAGRLELVITAWILHIAAIASVLLLVVVYHTEDPPCLEPLGSAQSLGARFASGIDI
jgi:hypothetical protein